MQRELDKKLSGIEVYNTNSSILLVKNMLCSKLHCENGFNLIIFSYKTAGFRVHGAWPFKVPRVTLGDPCLAQARLGFGTTASCAPRPWVFNKGPGRETSVRGLEWQKHYPDVNANNLESHNGMEVVTQPIVIVDSASIDERASVPG